MLNWFRKQLASYDCLAVNDMTYSFQDGLALCAIIHRYVEIGQDLPINQNMI